MCGKGGGELQFDLGELFEHNAAVASTVLADRKELPGLSGMSWNWRAEWSGEQRESGGVNGLEPWLKSRDWALDDIHHFWNTI